MNEKDMIERYIYEVTRRVPQETKEEIRLELQSLIEDMCTQEDSSVEEVLQKLGNPGEFAKRYRDENNYLIGPDYYDNYMWVLKIALIGIAISAVVSAIVQGITAMGGVMETTSWVNFFVNFFTELFITSTNGIYSMVGVVTIIFAVLEWRKVKVSIKPEEKWSVNELNKNVVPVKSWTPDSLPPIPDKRAVISRGDKVVSIVFITVFAALLLFAPQVLGAFHYDGNTLKHISCVFNLEAWNRVMPLLIFCLFVGLVDEIIQLVTGYYCKPVMCSSILCNSIQIVGSAILFKFFPVWNPDFVKQIQEYAGISQFSEGDLLRFWGTGVFDNFILAGICVISLIEVGVTVYKTLRYA